MPYHSLWAPSLRVEDVTSAKKREGLRYWSVAELDQERHLQPKSFLMHACDKGPTLRALMGVYEIVIQGQKRLGATSNLRALFKE